jgi:hypothetical protein
LYRKHEFKYKEALKMAKPKINKTAEPFQSPVKPLETPKYFTVNLSPRSEPEEKLQSPTPRSLKDVIREHRKKKRLSRDQIPVEIITPFGKLEDVDNVL